MKEWIEVEARLSQPPDDWSLLADVFTRFGCNSSLVSADERGLTGYLQNVEGVGASLARLREELSASGAETVEVREVDDQDWSEIWKKHFKPHRIGKRFVVVPSWEPFEAGPEDLCLLLDPGQAFGTGEHPTTQLCLELLEARPPSSEEARVLDLGCGSGILAIAAAKLGYAQVSGADIEASAVAIAAENAKRNQVDLELYAGDGFGEWASGRTWDLVLSNIISATLIRLANQAYEVVAPGGSWVVSGVLKSNWPEVLAAAEAAGFRLDEVRESHDWIGAALRRPS